MVVFNTKIGAIRFLISYTRFTFNIYKYFNNTLYMFNTSVW